MYSLLIRPFLFLFDAESVHHATFRLLRFVMKIPPLVWLLRVIYVRDTPDLAREICGIRFPNPVGLAAGFDKDAIIGANWKHLGFGFVELGTITPRPQVGNPKKRLFRLPKDKAILNRMGFNNEGVEVAVSRLKKMDKTGIVIGANIGKNKDTPNEDAVSDYLICFEKLFPFVDYFVVNVSSPNTPGLRELQEKAPLTRLLSTLNEKNKGYTQSKPIFLKIAPDLTEAQLDDIVEVVQASGIQGLIATNTTISRESLLTDTAEVTALGAGGISGYPLRNRSTEVIRYLAQKSEGKFPIIGVGGIMQASDAVAKLEAGASLVQIYTGFVYGGPGLVKRIKQKLIKS